jgi:hypothetical protein
MSFRAKHANQTNPCARVLADIAQTCFLIGEETEFQAHMSWAAHVNQLEVRVLPKGATWDKHAKLELNEYVNIAKTTGIGTDDFATDTYPKVKRFARELKAFYERAAQAA